MPTYRAPQIHSSEITPEQVWQSRRHWMKAAGASLLTSAAGAWPSIGGAATLPSLDATVSKQFFTMEPRTPEKDAASYNNFYEFGLNNPHILRQRSKAGCCSHCRRGDTDNVTSRHTKVHVPDERDKNSTGFAVKSFCIPSQIQRASGYKPAAKSKIFARSSVRAENV